MTRRILDPGLLRRLRVFPLEQSDGSFDVFCLWPPDDPDSDETRGELENHLGPVEMRFVQVLDRGDFSAREWIEQGISRACAESRARDSRATDQTCLICGAGQEASDLIRSYDKRVAICRDCLGRLRRSPNATIKECALCSASNVVGSHSDPTSVCQACLALSSEILTD